MVVYTRSIAASALLALSLGASASWLGCGAVEPVGDGPSRPFRNDNELPPSVAARLTECVLKAGAPFPEIGGNTHAIDLDVQVSNEGVVTAAQVKGSTMEGHASERCMTAALEGASLHLPRGGSRRSASSSPPTPESRVLLGQAIALAPISFVPLVVTGIGIVVVIGVIAYFQKPDNEDYCQELLVECLESPEQPEWNRKMFGPKKDCGACKRYCVNEGYWPQDKCPRTK